MSITRLLCPDCGFPVIYCRCADAWRVGKVLENTGKHSPELDGGDIKTPRTYDSWLRGGL